MDYQIAELLVNNPTIGMDFYLVWSDEKKEEGDTNEWFQHFQFLLPFFLSPHYLKIGGYPIIMIHQSAQYPSKMYQLWTQLAQQNGFGGLYLTTVLTSKTDVLPLGQHEMKLNPSYAISDPQKDTPWSYSTLCHQIVNSLTTKNSFYSMFVKTLDTKMASQIHREKTRELRSSRS